MSIKTDMIELFDDRYAALTEAVTVAATATVVISGTQGRELSSTETSTIRSPWSLIGSRN